MIEGTIYWNKSIEKIFGKTTQKTVVRKFVFKKLDT